MPEKVELPQISIPSAGKKGGAGVRLYGSPLCRESDIFEGFNQDYIKKKPKKKKKKQMTETQEAEPDHTPQRNKEGRYQIVTELLNAVNLRSDDIFDFLETFTGGERGYAELNKAQFTAGITRVAPKFSPDRSRELFKILDKDFVGMVHIHQLTSLITFAQLERGTDIESTIHAVCKGLVWEKLFCLAESPPKQGSPGASNRSMLKPPPAQNSLAPPSVSESKEVKRKLAMKERRKKRKKFSDEFPRVDLPFTSVISMLRSICPPETFTPDGDILVDPLEVFIAGLFDILKAESKQRHLGGGANSPMARSRRGRDLMDSLAHSSMCSEGEIGGGGSSVAPSRNGSIRMNVTSENGAGGHPDISVVEALVHPFGEGSDSQAALDGKSMALGDIEENAVAVALRRSRQCSIYDISKSGPVSKIDPGVDKLKITISDLTDFASSQYDFQIRIQTEQFNWGVFLKQQAAAVAAAALMQTSSDDGGHVVDSSPTRSGVASLANSRVGSRNNSGFGHGKHQISKSEIAAMLNQAF